MQLQQQGIWKPAAAKAKQKPAAKPAAEPIVPEDLSEMTASHEACPSSYLGTCVLALIDGSPNNLDKDKHLSLIRKVCAMAHA